MKCIEDEIPFEVPEGWEWCRLPVITTEIFAGGDKPDIYEKNITKIFPPWASTMDWQIASPRPTPLFESELFLQVV